MLKLISADLTKEKVDTLIIPVCKDADIHTDPIVSGIAQRALKLEEFEGEPKDAVTLYEPAGIQARRVSLMGLGKLDKTTLESFRAFSGKAVKQAIQQRHTSIAMAVPDAHKVNHPAPLLLQALAEGALLGNHLFARYKHEEKRKPLQTVWLLTTPAGVKENARMIQRVQTACLGAVLARDWVNTPSNEKTPDRFAQTIVRAARQAELKSTVLDETVLKKKKFGAMLAVGAGSQHKPRLVVLEYRPKAAKKTIVLVGKGVTFDSGGLNLKPTGSLETMKADMSGAAVAAATVITASKLKAKVNLIGLMPIVENMPSGSATRPGDIVRTFSGKTVEIGNTDAEGRLILADTLSYAVKTYAPHTIIDLATLTGACVVALGEKIAGLFSRDDSLAAAISASAERTHERCWRLPLPEDYAEELKSDFADIKNVGSTRWGGAITAALFLSEFVSGARWAHIDIAGPSYLKKESAYCGPGGTGFGVRLLCDLLDTL